jgi:ankyrin repeat protein
MYASSYGHEEVADILLEHGADINHYAPSGTPLGIAAYAGQLKMVTKLLDAGADINAKSAEGYTPLMTACNTGRTEVVQLLISRGANLNLRDENGHTAMGWAAHEGHIDLVRLLQQAGAKE